MFFGTQNLNGLVSKLKTNGNLDGDILTDVRNRRQKLWDSRRVRQRLLHWLNLAALYEVVLVLSVCKLTLLVATEF